MINWSSGNWHIGYLIGVPILSLATLLLLGGAVSLLVNHLRANDRWNDSHILAGGLALFGVLTAVGLAFVVWPLDSTFHKYYRVTGDVEQISSRMIAVDKAMSQRFVVVLDGQPFAIDDTRASLLKVGDPVALQCSREYQYAGDSGWSCEWGQR